jgi:dihydrofolate reductase
MARITVVNNLSLDGVMQAPGRSDEDDRDGFEAGGWAVPYNDPVMGQAMGERMAQDTSLLLGRRTYEDFAGFWPKQTDNPFTAVLNSVQKYVATRTLSEPLWENSTLLAGDARDTVAALKRSSERDLVVLGSGELLGVLISEGLIDEYLLLIHPVYLGSGRRMFPAGVSGGLALKNTLTTTTGVVIATYEAASA